MPNLQENKRLTFRHKFPSTNPKGSRWNCRLWSSLCYIWYTFCSPVGLVGRNGGQLLFVCIYYERAPRLRLEELHQRYEKGGWLGMHGHIVFSIL